MISKKASIVTYANIVLILDSDIHLWLQDGIQIGAGYLYPEASTERNNTHTLLLEQSLRLFLYTVYSSAVYTIHSHVCECNYVCGSVLTVCMISTKLSMNNIYVFSVRLWLIIYSASVGCMQTGLFNKSRTHTSIHQVMSKKKYPEYFFFLFIRFWLLL